MERVKEIHFYTNLCNETQTSEWDLEDMKIDWVSSWNAIEDPDEMIVKTTQLYLLSNAWAYIDRGNRVFVHNGEKVLEVKEHMEGTIDGKDIRKAHNICKLLCGGVFGSIE